MPLEPGVPWRSVFLQRLHRSGHGHLVRFPVPTSAQWATTLYGFIRYDCVCVHILHNMGCGVDIRAEHLSMTSFGSGWQAVRMQLFIHFLESNIS